MIFLIVIIDYGVGLFSLIVRWIVVIYNIGVIIGGLVFGMLF